MSKKSAERSCWDVVGAVLSLCGRVLLFGPCGTGKTYAAAKLGRTFQTRSAAKIYWALVKGVPRPPQGKVEAALVKASGLKVQAAIQGEAVRVTGKKRDDLQDAIAVLRASDLDLPLQFTNFRD